MKKVFFILLVVLFTWQSAQAQNFPVQASVNLIPPYSPFLSDYVSPGSNKIALNILLKDINRPELNVRLRLRIEGEGITIETKHEFLPPAFFIQGGVPLRLSGEDFQDYFNPENLNFQGITRQQFQKTGKLPEGIYQFCFEVLEYNRGVKISNAACVVAWVILNDPPIINVPENKIKLRAQLPQNVIFQWTPRHTGSPNSAFSTEYEFKLVEIWPENRDPNDAILTSPPIYETTTQSTTLIYGPAETPLEPGRKYAFRVKAKAMSGIDELDLFKNDGYSQTHTFTYGDACVQPLNINTIDVFSDMARIEWEAAFNHTAFTIRYREDNDQKASWVETTTFDLRASITNLKPGTSYEYQVAGSCGSILGEFSASKTITTSLPLAGDFSCGLPLGNFSFENTSPLPELKVGDIIFAGDFDVKITKASGSAGIFSGEGTLVVPFMNQVKTAVAFKEITVNKEYRMITGNMNITGTKLEVIPQEVMAMLDQLDEALDDVDGILTEVDKGLNLTDEILDQVGDLANEILDNGPFSREEEIAYAKATIEEYRNAAKEKVAAAVAQLATASTTAEYTAAARNVAQAMALSNRAQKLQNINDNADTVEVIAVEFMGAEQWGFDTQIHEAHRLHYNILVTPDNQTHGIPWISTLVGQRNTARARFVENESVAAENIIFKSGEEQLTATKRGDEWIINLPEVPAGQQKSILSLDKTTGKLVGKLDVIGYKKVERKVNLILVNGAKLDKLAVKQTEDELNRIYGQAVASWQVKELEMLNLEGFNGTLQDDEQALLSTYSSGMRDIIEAFQNRRGDNKDEFYLFIVADSQTGKSGYMPRKHRYGFIYANGGGDISRTIAHELGHGAFRLQHTFEEYPTITEQTQNLMDYGTGTVLRKYQWDMIHNPPVVVGLVEDEQEGAIAGLKWFTPKWEAFSLPREVSSRIFASWDNKVPNGTVPGFTLTDGTQYLAAFDGSGSFVGYYNGDEKYSLPPLSSLKPDEEVYVFKYEGDCSNNKHYASTYGFVISSDYVKTGSKKESFFASLGDGTIIPCAYNLKNLCEKGREYFETYSGHNYSASEEKFLFKISELICEDSVELFEAQFAQYKKWEGRAKTISEKIQGNSFSFEKYYHALIRLKKWRENNLISVFDTKSAMNKEEFRDAIFEIAYQLDPAVISLLSIGSKIRMLTTMLDGKLYNLFGSGFENQDELVSKVVKSIKDEEAKIFLDALVSSEYNNSDGKPLIYVLKENLSDFLNSENPYTGFFIELKRLTDARSRLSGEYPDAKVHLKWDVEQKDYVLLSFVHNRNDYKFYYDNDKHTVQIETCKKWEYKSVGVGKNLRYEKTCVEKVELLDEGASPFDIIGLTILNDVSPFGNGCGNSIGTNEFCGQEILVPAIFLDYLQNSENAQRLQNFGWNTFNVIITVSTLGEGAAAISAIRAAETGRKIYVATKNAYTLLDFTYTVTDLTLQAANVERPKYWTWIGYAFAAKSSYDLLRNGGVRGVASMQKLIEEGKADEVYKVVEELGVLRGGKKLTKAEIEKFVNDAKLKIIKNPELKVQYDNILAGITPLDGVHYSEVINTPILVLKDAPNGYQFYKRNGKEWIRRIDASNPETPRLTVNAEGKIIVYHASDVEKVLLNNLTGLPNLRSWIDNFTNPALVKKISELDPNQLKNLKADIASDMSGVLKESFEVNAELVDSWKVVKYCDDPALAAKATNIAELELLSKNIDDVARLGGYKEWNRILRGAVKNGDELLYRLSKIDVPKPEIYMGDFYRTVGNGRDPLLTHYIPRGTPQRYAKPGEDAIFFSSSKEGNSKSWLIGV